MMRDMINIGERNPYAGGGIEPIRFNPTKTKSKPRREDPLRRNIKRSSLVLTILTAHIAVITSLISSSNSPPNPRNISPTPAHINSTYILDEMHEVWTARDVGRYIIDPEGDKREIPFSAYHTSP